MQSKHGYNQNSKEYIAHCNSWLEKHIFWSTSVSGLFLVLHCHLYLRDRAKGPLQLKSFSYKSTLGLATVKP